MTTVSDIRRRSNTFVNSLDIHAVQSIEQNEEALVQLNRDQLTESKRSDGATIKPSYSAKYAAFKGFSSPDLMLTGSFYNQMFLIINPSSFDYFISSNDWKTTGLVEKYTEKIFGIGKENQIEAKNMNTITLGKKYRKFVLHG